MKTAVLAAVVLVFAQAACAEETFEPDRSVVFKTTTDAQGGAVELKMHLFLPEGHQATDKRPAIVFFFGGGWVQGTPTQLYPHCQYLASRGMVAMAAEYRVKNQHHTSPRQCVEDGKSAVRWARAHAKELGIDPHRIAAGGGSAGGHVAAATATVKGFDDANDDLTVSARPDALVLFNPVFDNGPDGYGHDRVKDYWREISPMHNIDEHTPPTIVFFGTKDSHVPVETAKRYQQLMQKHQRRCDLHLYEGQRHGFFNYGRDHYALTVIEMDRFLASLGYLEGEPTLEAPPQN